MSWWLKSLRFMNSKALMAAEGLNGNPLYFVFPGCPGYEYG